MDRNVAREPQPARSLEIVESINELQARANGIESLSQKLVDELVPIIYKGLKATA